MAQVPIYEGPQVRQQALQPVYQRVPDVSSGGQALARSLGGISNALMRQADRAAETEANTIDQDITAGWLEWNSAAQRDPKYRGTGVDQYEADATAWWEDARQKYGANASPLARRRIDQALGQKRNSAIGSVMGYANAERDRFADAQAEAAAQKAIEFGVDTGDTAGAAARVRQIAAEIGARKGWDTDMVMAEQQRLLGTLHLSHLETLANRDPAAARQYLEANKAEIPAQQQSRLETILKGAEDGQFAQQFATEQVGKPYAEQIAAARDIADPERRQKTITAINQSFAIERAMREEREQSARDNAWQLVAQGQSVPETVLADMDGASRVDLQDYVTRKAKMDAEGRIPTTNWGVYYKAREDIAAGTPINLQALSLDLAPAELKEIIKLATPVNQGADAGAQDALFTLQQRVNSAVQIVVPDFDSEEGKAAAGLFQNEVDRLVRVESDAKRRKLTPDEEQAIVDRVAMNRVFVNEWGTDPQLPVAILTEEQQEEAYVTVGNSNVRVSAIPAQDRLQITAALRQAGLPVTEFEIAQMYLAGKQARGNK